MRDHTKLRVFELADEVAVLVYKDRRNRDGLEWLDSSVAR